MTLFRHGEIAGPQVFFCEDGIPWGVANHNDKGQRIGKTISFRRDGSIEREENYNASGKLLSTINRNEQGEVQTPQP